MIFFFFFNVRMLKLTHLVQDVTLNCIYFDFVRMQVTVMIHGRVRSLFPYPLLLPCDSTEHFSPFAETLGFFLL